MLQLKMARMKQNERNYKKTLAYKKKQQLKDMTKAVYDFRPNIDPKTESSRNAVFKKK